MATELVLLSDVPVTVDAQSRALQRAEGRGRILEFRGGEFTSLVGADGSHLLTVHAPKVIQLPDEAAAAVVSPPRSFALWTEMTVPFGVPENGYALAEALAAEVGGRIEKRK